MIRMIKNKNEEVFEYKGITAVFIKCKPKKIKKIKSYIVKSMDLIPIGVINYLINEKLEIKVLGGTYIDKQIAFLIAYNDMPKSDAKVSIKDRILNSIEGLFIYGKPFVFITEYNCKYVLLHEIGHFLDNKIDRNFDYNRFKILKMLVKNKTISCNRSDQKEFKEIYNSEKQFYWSRGYYKKKSSEYFAQSFAMCIYKDEKFIRKCPRTNKYINDFINSYL